jgi:phenylalanyl-tRNA synthetase alpha chain
MSISVPAPSVPTLSVAELRRALAMRDLTDPDQGPHALQLLVDAIVDSLRESWGSEVRLRRASPVVSTRDNYDRLGYAPDAVTRDARYTRYVCDVAVLRTQTSAMIPAAITSLAGALTEGQDLLLVCPGITYRRDAIDRLHTGEPHQLDLWRLTSAPLVSGISDLEAMIASVVAAVLPGRPHRTTTTAHPYTEQGRQVDVLDGGEWVEIGECGLAHPRLLAECGHDPARVTGLAMGLGLDRLLMLRKGISDIRLLRSTDPRVHRQLLDLAPYRAVSSMPPVRRDLSLALERDTSLEDLGDRVRAALGNDADVVESVELLSRTPYESLPASAIARMGVLPSQENALVRVTLRALERTLTHEECNLLRDRVYRALHRGSRSEWATRAP